MRIKRGITSALVGALVASVLGSADGGVASEGPCGTTGADGGDWPVFQHDVTATGSQPEESKIGVDNVGDLEPAWVASLGGSVESPPVEAGGCVYIGTQEGTVSAFNVDNGDLVWRVELPTATTLSVAQGRVFAQSGGTATAIGATSGEILWQRDFAPGPSFGGVGSPLAFEDFLVVGVMGDSSNVPERNGCCDGARSQIGYYAILDQATGETVVDGFDVSKEDHARGMEGSGFWSHPTYDPEDKYVYFGTAEPRSVNPENPTSNALLKIDADPRRSTFGEIVGHFRAEPLNTQVSNTPFVGPLLCEPPVDASPLCFDDHDWSSSALIYHDSSGRKLLGSTTPSLEPLPRTGGPLLGAPQGNFFAIDPTTPPSSDFAGDRMTSVWSAPTSGARAAVAGYDGSKIYYSSGYNGQIVAVHKDTGDIRWKASTLGPNLWQHVSVANGVVYSPGGHQSLLGGVSVGMLLAFDARDGTPLLQRPLAPDVNDLAMGTVAGGVTIARNTVFVPTNGTPLAGAVGGFVPEATEATAAGYLVAYRLPS